MLNRRESIGTMLLGGLGWFACPLAKASSEYRDQRLEEIAIRAMGSEFNIRWETSGAENVSVSQVRATVSAMLEKWNSVLSDYDDESEASVLTQPRNVGLWQEVSVELAEAITLSKKWFELSQGAFDVTCGAVTALRRKRRLASSEEWEAAIRTMGWDAIEWDDKKRAIKIQRQGLKFDFGGIGKGLVVDKATELMRELGLGRCIVNFSGNLRAGDAPSDREGWPVEIESLKVDQSEGQGQAEGRDQTEARDQTEGRGAYRFRLANGSMATSGDQFQSFPDWKSKSQQERTSHILDPKHGGGLVGKQMVTIFAREAADADAAATAACVQLQRNRRSWLEELGKSESGIFGVAQEIVDGRAQSFEFGGFSDKLKLERS